MIIKTKSGHTSAPTESSTVDPALAIKSGIIFFIFSLEKSGFGHFITSGLPQRGIAANITITIAIAYVHSIPYI